MPMDFNRDIMNEPMPADEAAAVIEKKGFFSKIKLHASKLYERGRCVLNGSNKV